MKKTRIFSLIFIIILSCLLISCGGGNDTDNVYTVSFMLEDGSVIKTVNVAEGETVATPQDPKKESYTFIGWYTNAKYGAKYDFSQKVTGNLNLYARFELDGADIANRISKGIMKSIVKVYAESYNTFLGIFETDSSGVSQGSGFCFDAGDGVYYIITNCHVAVKREGYDKQRITIEDYKGNTYTGYLYSNAISAEYDLACLYFRASSTEVTPLSIVKDNPKIGDDVISLGAPKDQSNSITFGKVLDYMAITLDAEKYESNVSFEVIRHSAGRDGGSSGGPVLNSRLQVVGVNYAKSNNDKNTGFAIPAEKVNEFLQKYVYK